MKIDALDDVLDLAAEVMTENAPDPGSTRLERLARYVVANLGGEPYTVDRATLAVYSDLVSYPESVADKRKMAVALLRLAEEQEE